IVPQPLQAWVPFAENVARAIVTLVLGWIVARWTQKLTRRALSSRHIDQALASFLSSIAQYVVLAAVVLSALSAVGIQTMSLTVVFGAAGLAIAAALQGSLGHFASGVLLLFFRTFDLGHKVTVAGQTGIVQDIGLFATTLLTADNQVIIVPNGEITKAAIVNHSVKGVLRGCIDVVVGHGAEAAKMADLLRAAAKNVPTVEAEPAPDVRFHGVTAGGVEFHLYFWGQVAAFPGVATDVRRSVYDALRSDGVDVPMASVVITSIVG
ncbi:MAG TPA: mechanosensitive ion channel domain-containing protein, partial [Minicystis sp.]|nr:mechanosensitive ion channel domain-containing protein [Minicystis sp.]